MNVDYLLEMQFDFTNQLFYSYVTDITNGGQPPDVGLCRIYSYKNQSEPGDDSNSDSVAVPAILPKWFTTSLIWFRGRCR